NSGYYYPGIGADHLVEIYGEDTGLVSTAMLYSFDESRGKDDWNGFFSLTNIKANSTSADGISTAIELQIANFDIGIDAGDGMKYLITASDSTGNMDVTNVMDLSRNEYLYEDSVSDRRDIVNSYRKGQLDGIDIDGDFADWNNVNQFKADSNDNDIVDSADILRFANFTDKVGETFYYISTEGNILDGTSFTSESAKNKGTSGGFDVTLGDGIDEIKYDTVTLSNRDQIFIYIDTDYDSQTGFGAGGIGAEKVIEIEGHYGLIESSTMKTYVEIAQEWGSEVDVETANDDDEIEIFGATGNYYIYIKSWNNDVDKIEAEIYNKVTLPVEENGEDGSRGTPNIPAWNSASWDELGADNNDASTNGVDIFNSDSGSRTDNLMYYADGESMYFMFFLEADPTPSTYTYSVLLEDGANDGDYDFVISSYNNRIRLYAWDSGISEWDYTQQYTSTSYFRFETTDGQEHVAMAVPYSDTFTPTSEDHFKVATTDDSYRAYAIGWFDTRNPSPAASNGDFTTAASIPEFSTLLMPIASVMLIVGNRIKNKKNNQH
ncbi:MAG: hypothetical protein VYB85_03620, partial [Candidatus Thermoplasmatota archaeon]|nr:hypothetical protein [Candidatus Thermoplasmatota archaeon]